MYGLIGKFHSTPGRRDELIALMTEKLEPMPGCLSYVVAKDPANADAIWITEVWTDRASHEASLKIPAVKSLIERAMPLIGSFELHIETEPVGGHGL